MTRRFAPDALRDLATQILRAERVAEADARIVADALVDADLHGTSTHGLSRLAIYTKRLREGLIEPRAELRVERRRPVAVTVDGGNGLGQVQAVKTLEELEPLAREHGVAAATIRRSQHFGALGYYGNRAAARDQILLAMTSCEPSMSPSGGADPFFGTNPIGASFPTNKGYPVKIDLATSKVARGHIIAARKEGRAIPDDWALDPDGRATTDAAQALAGTVLTMAGHKGYALAMLVEAFSSVLSGSAIGPDIGSMYKDLDRPQDVGHFFCLFHVEAFMDAEAFRARMDETIDRLKRCRTRPGEEEILVPGERSARKAQENARLGVPLGEATVAELRELAAERGVGFDPDALAVEGGTESS